MKFAENDNLGHKQHEEMVPGLDRKRWGLCITESLECSDWTINK